MIRGAPAPGVLDEGFMHVLSEGIATNPDGRLVIEPGKQMRTGESNCKNACA